MNWTAGYPRPTPTPLRPRSSRPPSSPPSFVSLVPRTSVGLSHLDHVTSRGRDPAHAQHRDNDANTPPSLRPYSVVVTIDPTDVSTTVVASEHREVQHTTILRHLYKNNTFRPIQTLSCVLAFIANNKGTLNTPVCSLLSPRSRPLSLSLLLALALARSLSLSPQIFVAQFSCLSSPLPTYTPDPNRYSRGVTGRRGGDDGLGVCVGVRQEAA
jgi:hypothetical protein